jgi:hypothetical protein
MRLINGANGKVPLGAMAWRRAIEQPASARLGQHVARLAAGPAFDDQPALTVA